MALNRGRFISRSSWHCNSSVMLKCPFLRSTLERTPTGSCDTLHQGMPNQIGRHKGTEKSDEKSSYENGERYISHGRLQRNANCNGKVRIIRRRFAQKPGLAISIACLSVLCARASLGIRAYCSSQTQSARMIRTGYSRKTGSAVTRVNPSHSACAIRIRSKGSRCSAGNRRRKSACSMRTGSSSNLMAVICVSKSSGTLSFPRAALISISQAEAALTYTRLRHLQSLGERHS